MKTIFELQSRSLVKPGFGWRVMEYIYKSGELSRRCVFNDVDAAKKERTAMRKRSAKYGWQLEFRIVKVVTTYEIIED